MGRTISERVVQGLHTAVDTLAAVVKLASQSGATRLPRRDTDDTITILGNGPSLRQTIAKDEAQLAAHPTMAVNFMANTEEFFRLRPRWYILIDPHFFSSGDANVERLWQNLRRADWQMTLIVPATATLPADYVAPVWRINAIGVEGAWWLRRKVYDARRGMPRPRNVLIPAIMSAVWLGYTHINIVGADHTWLQTLGVDDGNRVVSIQPHFYTESEGEKVRVASVYQDVKLHEILDSFRVAFKSYHDIARWLRGRGVEVVNHTPGSFIDAFPRG